MISTKVKTIVFVSALFLLVGFIAVGCKQKPKETSWVNTKSLPGNTFADHSNTSAAKHSNSRVVYLGSNSSSSDSNFGPRDVSFDFQVLR